MTDYLPKILVVDDYPANLAAMKKLLAGCSAQIFTASSGNEALTKTLDRDFSLILLDVQMPEMDGFETAEIIRTSGRTKVTPIIFLTAFSKDEQNIFKGYNSGLSIICLNRLVPQFFSVRS